MTKFDDAYAKAQAMRTWAGLDTRTDPPFMTKRGIGIWQAGNDGDVMVYAGMLALSGEEIGISTCKRSQGPDGKIWRSPARIGVDVVDSNSRDQMLGFMAYLVASKDVEAAKKFQQYLENNKWKLGNDATDNRETLTPTMYGLMGYVWKFLKLPINWRMRLCMGPVYYVGQFISSTFSPVSYQTELVGDCLLIMHKIGINNVLNKVIANALIKRDPENAFYQYLVGNLDKAIDLALEQMPDKCPDSAYIWSFEAPTSEGQYVYSMGWDYIFLMNLIRDKVQQLL